MAFPSTLESVPRKSRDRLIRGQDFYLREHRVVRTGRTLSHSKSLWTMLVAFLLPTLLPTEVSDA